MGQQQVFAVNRTKGMRQMAPIRAQPPHQKPLVIDPKLPSPDTLPHLKAIPEYSQPHPTSHTRWLAQYALNRL